MICDKNVTTVISRTNINHYKNMGYDDVNYFDKILVPVDKIYPMSRSMISVKCDYCGTIIKKVYRALMIERKKSFTKKDCCSKCIPLKNKETNLALYGVENSSHRKEVVDKIIKTNIERYGIPHTVKLKKTMKALKKFNKEKTKKQEKEIREKIKNTCIKKYGVDSVLKLDKTRKGLFETLKRGSTQQDKVYNILLEKYGAKKVIKNYYFSKVCFDILLDIDNVKIDVEYDSWYWHNKIRDRRRDEFIKSNGFKVIRIKSGRKIPENKILFKKISELLKNKDKKYSEIILTDWDEEQYSINSGREYERMFSFEK